MAAKLGGGDSEPIVDINITPLVDIILVVLIIFMVTATTDIFTPSIKVNLPEAATGEATEVTSLGLQLTSDGGLHLDGDLIDEAGLRTTIQSAIAKDEEVTCLIAADTDVPHGRVVWLLDVVKQEGVAKFAINIDPATAEVGRTMTN